MDEHGNATGSAKSPDAVATKVAAAAVAAAATSAAAAVLSSFATASIAATAATTAAVFSSIAAADAVAADVHRRCSRAVLGGAGVSTALATAYGLPVSATHGVISGLAAVAWFERGDSAIDGETLGLTVVAWVASPLCGAVVAGLIQLLLDRKHILRQQQHRRRELLVRRR